SEHQRRARDVVQRSPRVGREGPKEAIEASSAISPRTPFQQTSELQSEERRGNSNTRQGSRSLDSKIEKKPRGLRADTDKGNDIVGSSDAESSEHF
ncbi:hypothetical protein THAOC_22294, partial [Thalassiosira oceanica]